MKNWIFLVVIFLCAVLQSGFPEFLRVLGVGADLLFLCVAASSLFLGRRTSLFFSLLSGILKDLLAVHFFGINTLLFPLLSLALSETTKRISVDNGYLAAVVVLLASLAYSVLARVVFSYTGDIIALGIFLRIAFLQALYSALIFSLFFGFIKKITLP